MLLVASCSDDGNDNSSAGGALDVPSVCESICEKQIALQCPGEDPSMCQGQCEGDAAAYMQKCPEQTKEVVKCVAALPASGFECDDEGISRPKAGSCSGKEDALITCLTK